MSAVSDFGTVLSGLGMTTGCALHFNDFLVCNCGTPDGKRFSCTANAIQGGQPCAATIDLDRAILDQLIMACSPTMAMGIADGLKSRPPTGWMLPFDEPVVVEIEGRLGEKQCAQNGEVFIPIIATSIKGQNGYEPLSATLALVAIGREATPVINQTGKTYDKKRQQLRARVVEMGRLLNQQGGIDLMRKIFEAAVRYLSDERIVIGRWVECVWDGIGEWRG